VATTEDSIALMSWTLSKSVNYKYSTSTVQIQTFSRHGCGTGVHGKAKAR
jgi:hypothetical protein